MFEICLDFSKIGLKIYLFCLHSKKAKKWPNGQTILFLPNSFKKGQIWQKRPNGNHYLQICLEFTQEWSTNFVWGQY